MLKRTDLATLMDADLHKKSRCRAGLPDIPRWVETHDLLAWDASVVHASEDGRNFIVWSPDDAFASIIGEPDPDRVAQVAAECSELLAFPENIDFVRQYVEGFKVERATLFKAPTTWPAPSHPCRELRAADRAALNHLPESLREELEDAFGEDWPVIAACDGDLPVAIAYVVAATESLWDLSIDTLESHRRRGFAASAALALMERMATLGKIAVWGAAESNPASYNLARKLGFTKVDELWDLTREGE